MSDFLVGDTWINVLLSWISWVSGLLVQAVCTQCPIAMEKEHVMKYFQQPKPN